VPRALYLPGKPTGLSLFGNAISVLPPGIFDQLTSLQ
jgi:hypothetical protein